ncbi:MAG: hypothetical protein JO363_03565 [Solirubrobacterales bacterium]|nr:hypothetical protein [Solirubrobacterales bacterium]
MDLSAGCGRAAGHGRVGGHISSMWTVLAVPPLGPDRRDPRILTSEELANLAHLRRACDLMDRESARRLNGRRA